MPACVRGVRAEIRWAYYVAATVNGFTVSRARGVWTVSAHLVSADAFKLSQRPLLFAASHNGGEWLWPVQTVTRCDASTFAAILDPPKGVSDALSCGRARTDSAVVV